MNYVTVQAQLISLVSLGCIHDVLWSKLTLAPTGLAAGGLWGFREGLRKDVIPRNTATATPLATGATAPAASAVGAQATAFANTAAAKAAPTATAATTPEAAAAGTAAQAQARRISRRLRWNNVLNQVTRRGSFTGNSAGVLALIYNGFNSTLDSYRGHHDIYGSMFAGACTGALWRCTGESGKFEQIKGNGGLTLCVPNCSWCQTYGHCFRADDSRSSRMDHSQGPILVDACREREI